MDRKNHWQTVRNKNPSEMTITYYSRHNEKHDDSSYILIFRRRTRRNEIKIHFVHSKRSVVH